MPRDFQSNKSLRRSVRLRWIILCLRLSLTKSNILLDSCEIESSRPESSFWSQLWSLKEQFNKKTSPKGFSASNCDVGNWIFSKSQEFFEKLIGNFLDFLGIFLEDFFGGTFFEEFIGRNFLGGSFWENNFGRIFLRENIWEDFFWRTFWGGTFWEVLFIRNCL